MMSYQPIRAGTRGSTLALWQTEFVIRQLQAAWPDLKCSIHTIRSRGDRDQHTPLPSLGGKGLFTEELEAGLRNGEMDIAVHSLKDLPLTDPPGIRTGAILARQEVRDVLICPSGFELDTLPANSVVGTSSTRRCAQILARRPDLQVRSIRGNVDTRLRKLDEGQYDAIVLAGAGIVRMGLTDRVGQWLPEEWFTPAPGQGALAIQCRDTDHEVLELLANLHEPELAELVAAERGFLAGLGGGCSEPVGASARFLVDLCEDREPLNRTDTNSKHHGREISLRGWYSTPDGQMNWAEELRGHDGQELAKRAAEAAKQKIDRLYSRSQKILSPLNNTYPKIAVTRSNLENAQFCRLLLTAGFQPIVAPVIEILPQLTPKALLARVGALDQYDWLIFTSANAVRIFCELWQKGGGDIHELQTLKIATIGPHTADAADNMGLQVDFLPETFSAQGLLETKEQFAASRILLPRSTKSTPDLIRGLEKAGAEVSEIPLYSPQSVPLSDFALRGLRQGVDMITFASGSAVLAFRDEIEAHADLHDLLAHTAIACIGPQTAAVATELGLTVAVVSQVHNMEGLVQAISAYFLAQKSPDCNSTSNEV